MTSFNPQQPSYLTQPSPKPAKKRKPWLTYGGTALGAFVLGIAAGAGSSNGSPTAGSTGAASTVTMTAPGSTVTETGEAAAAETVTVTETAPAPSTTESSDPASGGTIPGDGTFQVGVDVQPGRYVSTTPDSGNCYWARMSGPDGFDDIIDNNNSSGQSVVTIKATDKYFESSGCNTWTKR
ncbi:hypothetical protein [Calidifontibacter terrae]